MSDSKRALRTTMSKEQVVCWHVMYKFEWQIGKIFTIEGLYRKLNGFGMNDDYCSNKRYLKVSKSTVRRAVEKMIVAGEVLPVKKNYNCYDRVQYKLLTTYPF